MPAGNPAAYLSPEVIAQLTGHDVGPTGTPISSALQGQMQSSLRQQGVFPGDTGYGAELLRRLVEVERTRRLSDARGNATMAENTRRGFFSGDWFMSDLKAALGGG